MGGYCSPLWMALRVLALMAVGAAATTQPVGRSSLHHATHPLIAQLQSAVEAHMLATGHGRQHVPPLFQQVASQVSSELLLARSTANPTPHVTALGFPLTVAESLALRAGLLKPLHLNNQSEAYRLVIRLAALVAAHGINDPQVHEYYNSTLHMFGEHTVPLLDLGWLNEFLGTLHLYISPPHGLHAYRKVPTKGCLLYTSPSPRDRTRSRMPSSAFNKPQMKILIKTKYYLLSTLIPS
eukprot:TRINITY_DN27901_c0_g1_i1.p1 TRINITY_DN27901_c0_g1~~TRINITY_DN27901_c0_g1_i1.p1  ORF type:complete len:239 (+),score=40.43 TRINITY_DN27901_c0_g1_i1:198-914(+)